MEKQDTTAFIKAPRSIVFARDLNANCKVILLLLIDRYNYLQSQKKLPADGSFYMTGEAFEEHTDLKKQQILRKVIPALEAKGLITKQVKPQDKKGVLKSYNYFTLNWDAINNYDGTQADEEVQERRAAVAQKAVEARKAKIEEIRQLITEMPIEAPRTAPEYHQTSTQDFFSAIHLNTEEDKTEEENFIKTWREAGMDKYY